MSLGKVKLIAIVNWIFHVRDFLILFMMSFKYGLISLKYYLIDRGFFAINFIYLKRFLTSLTMLLLDLVLIFWFSWFLSTSIHIVDMCWFIIIFSCVCFKKIHKFVFNPTHRFFIGLGIWLINQSYQIFLQTFSSSSFFLFKIIHIISIHIIASIS